MRRQRIDLYNTLNRENNMSMRRQKQADIGSGETKDFQDVCQLDNTYEDKRN